MVARAKNKDPKRIWSFHALAPKEEELAKELLFRGNRYYNTLLEQERWRFYAYRDIQARYVPALAAAQLGFEGIEREIKSIYDEIKKARSIVFRRTRVKSREVPPEFRDELDEVFARRKALAERYHELVETLFKPLLEPAKVEYARRSEEYASGGATHVKGRANKEVRAEMWEEDWPDVWKELSKLDADSETGRKRVRKICQLPSGCYSLVEKRVEQAVKTSLKTKGRPPRYRRFTGEGRIGVQVVGRNFGDLIANRSAKSKSLRVRRRVQCTPNVTFELAPPKAKGTGPSARKRENASKRSGEFFVVSMNVGTKLEGENKRRLSCSVRLDRQPSPAVEVKWVWLLARRLGGERLHYRLQLSLQGQDLLKNKPSVPQTPFFRQLSSKLGTQGTGLVHIKFCSQSVPGGVRVALWSAENGQTGELVLPQDIAERLGYPAVLRSHADTHYVEVRRTLSLYCRTQGSTKLELLRSNSEAQRIQIRNLCDSWAAHVYGEKGLRKLWSAWKKERFAADKDLFAHVSSVTSWMRARGAKTSSERLAFWCFLWARKDRHLRVWAGHQRERAEHQRDAIYRDAAIVLGLRFGQFVLDGTRFDQQKKKPKVEKESNEMKRMRTVRQNAAPGRCREIFAGVFGPRCKIERPSGEETPGGTREEDSTANTSSSAVEHEMVDAAE